MVLSYYSTYREQDIYIDWARMYARPYESAYWTDVLAPTWYHDMTAIKAAIDTYLEPADRNDTAAPVLPALISMEMT